MVKKKIAVLGGGVGAMSTVYYLTNEPDWQQKYDITVYQMGWRLGGKGASGRGKDGRIEEHGLHVWLGFYNNAFKMIQNVYGELGRPEGTPLATWEDAFKKHSYIVLAQKFKDEWLAWPLEFPTNEEIPGEGGAMPSLWDFLEMTLDWVGELIRDSAIKDHVEQHADSHEHRSVLRWLREHVRGLLDTGKFETETMAEEIIAMIEAHLEKIGNNPTEHTAADHSLIIHLLEALLSWLRRELMKLIDSNVKLLRLFILIDLATTGIIGLLKDGVLFHPLQLNSLDDEDMRAWFRRHGAAEETINSPIMAGWYDLVFAYHNGEIGKPVTAVGTMIYAMFRTFLTYKGAIFWKMQAGMGDTIFAPIYSVLKERGVKFEYFRRVTNLGLNEKKDAIDTIDIAIQATVKGEKEGATYDPYVVVNDLDCWPSDPNYDQLDQGDELRKKKINLESFYTPWKDPDSMTLKRGEDFDICVFGISLGSVPYVCPELVEASSEWQKMVENVETVRTMAFQVWTDRDLKGLGWDEQSPVLDAFVDPLNTWADMSQLIDRENVKGNKNIAYFCGPMVGGLPSANHYGLPIEAKAEVKIYADKLLQTLSETFWPEARNEDGTFDESVLLETFYRANIDPSERYVLSVPGSTIYRLKPGETGFDNLVITGDWTVNEINAGCVEGAVTSGMMAAAATAAKCKTRKRPLDRKKV